jgi:hypothetical protein
MTTTKRSQTVNFLGFLRGQLNGLQGIPTLCYELIQNADDVKDENGNPGASKIIFDVCDDALYVYNDGIFRDIDFTRMENVSWGNKREEVGTTGAFGIGFISVYQITDSPEILSSGRHWRFIPNGKEDERILETLMETKETKFRLPWAFESSEIRKELGIVTVKRDDLEEITLQIIRSVELAALFLKQINFLEVRRSGTLVRKFETIREGNNLLIADGTKTITFKIFEGTFNLIGEDLRQRFGDVIESKRQSVVRLAIPDLPDLNGLLYAFLPSESYTGLPFHINTDFYPTPDRKRIIFDETIKSQWNEAAIECAAEILANNCDILMKLFAFQDFWEFAERVKKASERQELSVVFNQFWGKLKPVISSMKSVMTSSNRRVLSSDSFFLDSNDLIKAGSIFEDIGIHTVHPDLRSKRNILLETGVKILKISDISDAFIEKKLTQRIELVSLPGELRTIENWKTLWEAIENLWIHASSNEKEDNSERLTSLAIAIGSDGAVWPPELLFKTDEITQIFFSKISSVTWYSSKLDYTIFLDFLIPEFELNDGLDLLEENSYLLPDLWKEGLYLPKDFLSWLEKNRHDIRDNFTKIRIKSLSLWPSATGELKPLSDLFLAGDFEDPLKLAQLVDLEALDGGQDFLVRDLNIQRLDFITYVREWIPFAFNERDLSTEEKLKLTEILAENSGKLMSFQDIRTTLSNLPIIWCGDDQFSTGNKAWFDTPVVREVLGSDIILAQLPYEKKEAIKEFYQWIGVSPEPEPKDIVDRIKSIIQEPPSETNSKKIGVIINFIADKWYFWNEIDKSWFTQLKDLRWLPGTKITGEWFFPRDVYSIFQSFLFESQGNFLKIDRKIQQNANDFFKFIGIESEPDPELVVNHLLFSSHNNKPINTEIYVFLTRMDEDPAINKLKDQKCLFLTAPEVEGNYFSPNQVFWEQHPFGMYRYRLSPDYGRFKNLFDKIGVKENPDVHDTIKVLLEISENFGNKNLGINNQQEEEILLMCWKLISDAVENKMISEIELQRKLGNNKTILNVKKMLTKPELMFFEDRPGWGEKFKVIKNNLIPRIEGAWLGMQAAGMRPLSSVVETEMITCENKNDRPSMNQLIDERINLIKRVIEEHRNKGVHSLSTQKLETLSFYHADQIEIERIFFGFNRQERSELELIDAILFDGSLYYSGENGNIPWKGIARELSFVINESGELRSLGLELKEILSQSFVEAKKSLDELGYPVLETKEITSVEGETIELKDDIDSLRFRVDYPEASDPTGPTPGYSQKATPPGAGSSGASYPGSGSSSQIRENSQKTPQNEKRTKKRLLSYVYTKDELMTTPEDRSFKNHRGETGKVGVGKVLQYEKERGRTPRDMEEIQVNHPGYDIESTFNGGIRYIEVKSVSGSWESQSPAQLTKFEFEEAKRKGKDYWIYVVEKVNTDDFRIFEINDPANRVDYYMFDRGWLPRESINEDG